MSNHTNPRRKITEGEQTHFFQEFDVSVSAFPDDCQVWIRIKFINHIRLDLISGNDVEYSFNGNHLHGNMSTVANTDHLLMDDIHDSKIWFRVPSGSATIRVEAW